MKLINLFNWVIDLVEAFTFYGGGSKGGGGGGNTTQTSYSTNLPEYAKPFYEELLKQTGKILLFFLLPGINKNSYLGRLGSTNRFSILNG